MNKIRLLLLPFSIIYGWILWLRNILYDNGVFKSVEPEIKSIVVGNLSFGGTGKTPHLSYLLNLLKDHNIAVLSRGYGRTSKGTKKVTRDANVLDVGDEPLQLARSFPNQNFVVDEIRLRGIDKIEDWYPNTNLILLDDALQHRQLKAGFNILLTTWDAPFFKDHYVPAGNLRDHRIRAKNADIILVTKCPSHIPIEKKDKYVKILKAYCPHVFFDRIEYQDCIPLKPSVNAVLKPKQKVLLITGIAKPEFLLEKVKSEYDVIAHFNYRDHYAFKDSDIDRIRNFIGRFAPEEISIVTTEKDAMRLGAMTKNIDHKDMPIFIWKIGVDLGSDKPLFDKLIFDYVG